MWPSALSDDVVTESIRFLSGTYLLEGELLYPESRPPIGAVVVANPHPLLGGDMGNNVVRGLTNGLAEHGLVALRFNYRGVGGSEGPPVDVAANMARFWETSHIPEEAELHADVDAAIENIRDTAPSDIPVAVVGYSFGCSLLPALSAVADLDSLVLIAPTVAKHDYDGFLKLDRPMLVIAPEDDFATEICVVRKWYDRLTVPKELATTRLDNHFFRGHEEWLTQTILAFLFSRWEVSAHADRD